MTTPAPPTAFLRRALLAVAIAVVFTFALLQSVVTTVAWWQGKLAHPDAWDWLWIGLMPVCVFVYVRYFSIFRGGCRACAPPEERSKSSP
jgi:hypothetical protein